MGTLLSVRFLAKALKMLRDPCLVETKAKGKKKDMIGHIISSIRCLRGTPGEKDEDKTRLKANEKSDEESSYSTRSTSTHTLLGKRTVSIEVAGPGRAEDVWVLVQVVHASPGKLRCIGVARRRGELG